MGLEKGRARIVTRGMVYALALFFSGSALLYAEQWPLRTYTTADGLVHDWVYRIVQDSRGFLWFCTKGGLSCFDGYQFINYTVEDGLPPSDVTDLVETRDGVYWVATKSGLYRFQPADPAGTPARPDRAPNGIPGRLLPDSKRKFVAHPLRGDETGLYVQVLLEDRAGIVWCGTEQGLYRLEPAGEGWMSRWVDLRPAADPSRPPWVTALREDRRGNLWIGTADGLFRRRPDGQVDHYTKAQRLSDPGIRALLEDREGRLWIGHDFALTPIVIDSAGDSLRRLPSYTMADGMPSRLRALFQSSDGRIWVGTLEGLSELVVRAEGGRPFKNYTHVQGLRNVAIEAIAQDRAGNLWLSTEGGGVQRLAPNGFVSYDGEDGLAHTRVRAIFESRQGDLCVLSGGSFIYRFDGTRFVGTALPVPGPVWGWNQSAFQDHTGEWWVPTEVGLYRFPKVRRPEDLAHAHPKAVYTVRDGLAGDDVYVLFEDSRGDLWIGTGVPPGEGRPPAQAGVTRWDRRRGTFHRYTEAQGLPVTGKVLVTAFCEDRAGHVWVGLGWAGLARYRDGHFQIFSARDGGPGAYVWCLYRDQAGQLWVATRQDGVLQVKDPTAALPTFVPHTTANGLSSNQIECFTEDRWGDLYIGTSRGVDRLQPTSGRITHYSAAYGLGVRGHVMTAFRDRAGVLWFGGLQGLARFVPEPSPAEPLAPAVLPPVFIRTLYINGRPYPVSELGQTEVPPIELGPDQNQIRIDFSAVSLAAGEDLRYQYRLADVDQAWSVPADERTIRFANLAPGTYRFRVRAVRADGQVSPWPAAVTFTIRPPLWRRAWFMALVAFSLGCLAHGLYRLRVAQLLALERVRMRIAADLHDDMASSLSAIALLGEAVQGQIGELRPRAGEMATEIAQTARRLVEAMNDIVWAIDPRRDDLEHLIGRIRQFAASVLEARGIAWTFQAPEELAVRLRPEQRRNLLLIFKEAVHNIVRHSGATAVTLTLTVTHQQLEAEIHDNGRGFAEPPSGSEPAARGQGLRSMQARAAQLGGHLQVNTVPGGGTHVRVQIPWRG